MERKRIYEEEGALRDYGVRSNALCRESVSWSWSAQPCMLCCCAYVDPCHESQGPVCRYFCLPTAAAAVLNGRQTSRSGGFCGFLGVFCFTTQHQMHAAVLGGRRVKRPLNQQSTRPSSSSTPLRETNNSTMHTGSKKTSQTGIPVPWASA